MSIDKAPYAIAPSRGLQKMNNQVEPSGKRPLRDRLIPSLQAMFPQIMRQNMTADTTEDFDQKDDDRHHKSLVDLPSELVLAIASCLDREYQLLLSLSCRRFWDFLGTRIDMTFKDDKDAKIRFLRLLELDHPEYLTCRPCCFLYLWKKRKFHEYTCPRGVDRHTRDDLFVSYSQDLYTGDGRYIQVRRGVVDLILRASDYSPSHGLPVSYLSLSGHDGRGLYRSHEARLVNGQLILASRIEFEMQRGQEMVELDRSHIADVCLHLRCTYGLLVEAWHTFEQAVVGMTVGWNASPVFKCPFCETDHQLRAKKNEGDRTTIIFVVWRNYGQRHENGLSHEQIFHRSPMVKLDASAVTQRNLQAAYESRISSG